MAGTVGVVDDDEDVRDVLRSLLEAAGHTVRPYASGRSLLSDPDIEQLDLVITDQNMPGLTGTDVLLEIGRRRLALPSVLITGSIGPEVTAAAQHLGAMIVLVKPIRPDELLSFDEAAVGWYGRYAWPPGRSLRLELVPLQDDDANVKELTAGDFTDRQFTNGGLGRFPRHPSPTPVLEVVYKMSGNWTVIVGDATAVTRIFPYRGFIGAIGWRPFKT